MSDLGLQLSLLVGPVVPAPASMLLISALDSVEVNETDDGRSGFQLSFSVDREPPLGLVDYMPLALQLLRPFYRVVVTVTLGLSLHVLIDGLITHIELEPGGSTKLIATGEDLGIAMDLEEKVVAYPALDETAIAAFILAGYAEYGIVPMVVPPPIPDVPNPLEWTPVQHGTDLEYLRHLAQRHGYVFAIEPGPLPLANVAYWGPPKRVGLPQPALSIDMGPFTNVSSINFRTDALAPTTVSGSVQDSQLNESWPIETFASMRPPLAAFPALPTQFPNLRSRKLRDVEGVTAIGALARAQGATERSTDRVVVAKGKLDGLQYGSALRARGTVGVRGVGLTHNGLYYVKRVTHTLRRGSYEQAFVLTREGSCPLTPVVRV